MDLKLKNLKTYGTQEEDKSNLKKSNSGFVTNFCANGIDNTIRRGMSVLTTVLFVAGENAGAGLLTLPHTLNKTGWIGVPLMLIMCFDAAIAGSLIGKCWLILEERWPEFQASCRDPYPAIGQMAYGSKMKSVITLFIQLSSIGSSCVCLMVCAQLTSDLIDPNRVLSYGVWILIVCAAICPLMWLGTPVEFWLAAAVALGTSTIAVAILLFNIVKVFISLESLPTPSPTNASTISLAFGAFVFAFGGTGPFPTFQNDMRKKNRFTRAVTFGFIILLILFLPLAVMGYLTYGSSVSTNIINSIPNGTHRIVVSILMTGHLFFASLLMINPALQQIEDKFSIPHTFNWKRVAIRVTMLCIILFLGESVPRFGKLLDLVGGSTATGLAFVFPPLFYIKLCSMKNSSWPDRRISLLNKLYYYKIILLGIVGGVCATIAAVITILGPNTFVLPCYIDFNCTYE